MLQITPTHSPDGVGVSPRRVDIWTSWSLKRNPDENTNLKRVGPRDEGTGFAGSVPGCFHQRWLTSVVTDDIEANKFMRRLRH